MWYYLSLYLKPVHTTNYTPFAKTITQKRRESPTSFRKMREVSVSNSWSQMNKRDVRGLRASARSAGILQYVLRKYTQTRGETNTRRTQLRTTNLERMIRLDVVRGRSVKLREL